MITCDDVSREFITRQGRVQGLDQVRLNVARGEFVTIKGASGSGKSTLLLTLGGMQRPTQGSVRIDGSEVYALSPADRARFRARSIGFVFQLFHLLPYLDTLENVLTGLPPGSDAVAGRKSAVTLLEQLGLAERAHHQPATLSAGERQRVALARALLKKPPVILADEPTGNLDPGNAAAVFEHLAHYHQTGGTVVVVTHGTDADRFANRTFHIANGRLAETTR
jgi:putative ABC transport system ATP-binding protein